MHMNLSLVLYFSLYFLEGYIAVFLSCILWCVLFVVDVDTISSIRGVAEIHLNLNLNLNVEGTHHLIWQTSHLICQRRILAKVAAQNYVNGVIEILCKYLQSVGARTGWQTDQL